MDDQELRQNFDHFDRDDNGLIDRDEFTDLMEALGADMSQAELDIGFSSIDTDASGRIDYAEFAAWFRDR